MILYHPTENDIYNGPIRVNANHCFVMTVLGNRIPNEIIDIRAKLKGLLKNSDTKIIDANDLTTGKDFLVKIWQIIISVPFGIAIISKELSTQTLENIFFELGMMQALGKSTLVVKTRDVPIPSDFIRTEYVEYDNSDKESRKSFSKKIKDFLKEQFKLAEYYEIMADLTEKNPITSIDYLIRAYLINTNPEIIEKIRNYLSKSNLNEYIKYRAMTFLSNIEETNT